MADEPIVEKPKNVLQRMLDGSMDIFEEARLMFFGAVLCLWLSLILCHGIKEMGAFTGICAAIPAMFGTLVAKMIWGKE